MKLASTVAVVGLTFLASAAPALAQGYGDYGGYRDYDRDRAPRYRDRGYDAPRGGYRGGGGYGFEAAEYLRCNPDVRRAVRNGQMPSAEEHYRIFGRREGRRLSC